MKDLFRTTIIRFYDNNIEVLEKFKRYCKENKLKQNEVLQDLVKQYLNKHMEV